MARIDYERDASSFLSVADRRYKHNSQLSTGDTSTIDNGDISGNPSVVNLVDKREEPEDAEPESKLPFSKARCIALVATVTTAGFMNVRVN